jgi:1-acyl-sn-glycerol-3-phosphate acyltransferase
MADAILLAALTCNHHSRVPVLLLVLSFVYHPHPQLVFFILKQDILVVCALVFNNRYQT